MDLLVSHKKYLLAYSGGLDSHVLLHLFASLRDKYSFHLRVIHINHGVSLHAEKWAAHCDKVCRQLNIPFHTETLEQIDVTLNLEEKLRQYRYQLFKNALTENEILLTAHHQNDQAETLLLQLCRGSGLKGLAAMPRLKKFGKGFHARPLLDFTRDDLLKYATDHALSWIDDESNANLHHTRNFIRHEVMPILAKRFPSVTKTLARSADHCAEAQEFIERLTRDTLTNMEGSASGTLSVKKLIQREVNEQQYILREWIQQAGFLLPSMVKMQQMTERLLHARMDKMPHVQWGNAEIRRYRDDLYMMEKMKPHDPSQIIPWDVSKPLIIPHIGTLEPSVITEKKCRTDFKNVTVQFRQGGEMLRLEGRAHRHELKKLFQMWGVLPWLRDRVPLVYVDGVLEVVVGYWGTPET
jgi:tRNA(Ile)-lysidine synthase